MALYDIAVEFIGAPTTSLELSLLYACVMILCVVTFDAVLGVFRMVGKALTSTI